MQLLDAPRFKFFTLSAGDRRKFASDDAQMNPARCMKLLTFTRHMDTKLMSTKPGFDRITAVIFFSGVKK